MIQLEHVDFSYAALPLIQDLSLSVRPGEFVSLVGPSGAGKSTIFKLITGLLQPSGGSIRVLDGPPAPGRVGYMPQRDCLMHWRTAVENAAAALEVQGRSPREAREQAKAHFAEFGLAGAEDRYPHQLSGGMRQRVAFLRTVLGGQSVLLLDEPFGALDALTRAQMQQWLLSLWQRLAKTVLFITHDAEEAALLSDRVYVLKGQTAQTPAAQVQSAQGQSAQGQAAQVQSGQGQSAQGQSAQGRTVEIPIDLPRPRSYGLVADPRLAERRAAILREVGLFGEVIA